MARLIDANDALERLKKAEKEMKVVTVCGCKAVPMYGVIDFVASRPTVDAVEVVRCKDCRSHEPCEVRNRVWCKTMGRYMKEDGFCSEGVKVDG